MTGVLDPDERFRVIEPAAGLDQAGDVLDVRLLRVVAPPRRVVLLSRKQLGSNPFRAVAPGAMVAGVVIDGADVPLLDHVAAAGVVRHLVFQQTIVPNVSSGKKIHSGLERRDGIRTSASEKCLIHGLPSEAVIGIEKNILFRLHQCKYNVKWHHLPKTKDV